MGQQRLTAITARKGQTANLQPYRDVQQKDWQSVSEGIARISELETVKVPSIHEVETDKQLAIPSPDRLWPTRGNNTLAQVNGMLKNNSGIEVYAQHHTDFLRVHEIVQYTDLSHHIFARITLFDPQHEPGEFQRDIPWMSRFHLFLGILTKGHASILSLNSLLCYSGVELYLELEEGMFRVMNVRRAEGVHPAQVDAALFDPYHVSLGEVRVAWWTRFALYLGQP